MLFRSASCSIPASPTFALFALLVLVLFSFAVFCEEEPAGVGNISELIIGFWLAAGSFVWVCHTTADKKAKAAATQINRMCVFILFSDEFL